MSLDLLKPDLKSVVWLVAGMFVVPKVIALVRGRTSAPAPKAQ